jgi:mannose-6-phosphate isomerase-like protein (cupin superfamily)
MNNNYSESDSKLNKHTDKVFVGNIENLTLQNNAYRKVIFTTITQQLVVMNLLPREEIGSEHHPHTTQFIRIESGQGRAILNGITYELADNMAVVIPPGTEHNIINTSDRLPLKLYTIYSPPEHEPDTLEEFKPNDLKGGRMMYRKNKEKYVNL